MKQLIILGVDPGSTLASTALGIDGKVLKLKSSKTLTMPKVVFEVMELGRVIAVGTDVHPAPSFVKKLATRLGARLIYPEQDMNYKEKNKLAIGKKFRNHHEKDALCSAVYAFKRIRRLITKVNVMLKRKERQELEKDIIKLIITTKHLSIDRAIKSLP
ncbi:MAG: DUF460 domain-containing protein [Candidatus Woesearchaeota archaeon]